VRVGEPEQLGDRGAEPAIAGAGGLAVQVERDRVGLAEWLPAGLRIQAARWSALRSTPRLRWGGVRPATAPEEPGAASRRQGASGPCRRPWPGPGFRADVVPDGTAGGLRRPLAPTVGKGHRARQPVGGCPPRRVRQVRKRVGSLISSQPWSGCTRMVWLPQGLSASPSAVRNSRSASHRARHAATVSALSSGSRAWRSLASRRPPRHTDTRPAKMRSSTSASLACTCRRRRCFWNRSARP
jgi:hypothetical protein